MKTKTLYSDLDLRFTKHPVKDDLVLSTNAEAVKRSVKNLLYTCFYERPFHPEIGCNLRKMLFDLNTDLTGNYMKKEIYNVLKNFEPRVELTDVTIDNQPDYNYVKISITFYIQTLTTPITLDVLLDRVR